MATRIVTGCPIKDIVKLGDPCNAPLSAIIWIMSLTQARYSQFCVEISKFLLPWQQGRSKHSLADTIKSGNPQNPLLRASIWAVSLTPAEL